MTALDEIIARGDAGEIVRVALAARFAAWEGRFCICPEPALYGYDLMCGNCLLENQEQIDRRERRIRKPHAFVLSRRDAGRRLGWCDICTRPEDDPRHGEPRPDPQEKP